MEKGKFIITYDKNTADELLRTGFELVNSQNEKYVFINSGNAKFSNTTKNKITYTDILCF